MPKQYAFYYKDENENKARELMHFAYEHGFILAGNNPSNYRLYKVGTENISITGKDLNELEQNLKSHLANQH